MRKPNPHTPADLMRAIMIPWLCTRMLLWKIAALWILLLSSTLLVVPGLRSSLIQMTYTAALVLLLITAFRLWDDIADIAFDRQRHTERVLVKHAIAPVFLYGWVTLSLLLAGLLLYLSHGGVAALGLFALILYMLLTYCALPALTPHRTLRNTLVLLKYPAMLIILSTNQLTGSQPDLNTLAIAAMLYGLLVIYENYTA